MRWDDPADDEDHIARTRKAIADLAPWTGRGVYVNMLNFRRAGPRRGGPRRPGEVRRAGATLKARYDPANLFRMNANIAPAGRRV